jgi:hypothetical protein
VPQTVLSFAELNVELAAVAAGVGKIRDLVRAAQALERYLLAGTTQGMTQITASVQNVLNDAAALRNDVRQRLLDLNFQHQLVVNTGRDMLAVNVNAVDSQAGNKTSIGTWSLSGAFKGDRLAGSPFLGFAAGDVVELSNAEDNGNNGKQFTVGSVQTDANTHMEKLVATTAVSGITGNTDDTKLRITLKKR